MSNTKNQQPYFPHYANSRNEDDLIKLRMEHGCTGYGVYYMLLERLRMSEDYRCSLDYKILAFDLRCEEELIESVICDFGLFEIGEDGSTFSSCEMNEYMRFMEERKQKRIEAARKAAEARWGTKSQVDETQVLPANVEQSEVTPIVVFPKQIEHEIDDKVLLSGFTDADATQRLNSEILVMAHDHVWLNAVLSDMNKVDTDLYVLMTEFRNECIKNGKKAGHKNVADAQCHFRFWMEKDMKKKAAGEDQSTKDKKPKSKKTDEEKRMEREAETAERNQRYEENEANKMTGEDYVRNNGYDPDVVTCAMLMKPGFRQNNPPTHPEWIGKFSQKSCQLASAPVEEVSDPVPF